MAKAAMRMKGNFLESFASGRSARAPVSSEHDDLLSLLRDDGDRHDAGGGDDANDGGYADPLEREARADLLATIERDHLPLTSLAGLWPGAPRAPLTLPAPRIRRDR